MEKLRNKIDQILWAVIWLLPVIGYLIAFWRTGSAPMIFEYINENFSFMWVKLIFDDILLKTFNTEFVLTGYISYLVGVELIHCLFDAIVFIPRFAHDLIDWACHLGRIEERKKK